METMPPVLLTQDDPRLRVIGTRFRYYPLKSVWEVLELSEDGWPVVGLYYDLRSPHKHRMSTQMGTEGFVELV